jgi:poly(3-hydroxybutyrate) depolymerase
LIYGGTFTKSSSQNINTGGTNYNYTDSNAHVRTHEISTSGLAHAHPAGSGGQNSNYVDSTKINYPQWVAAWFFANNIRVGSGTTTTTTAGTGTTTTTVATTTTTTSSNGACYTSSNSAHVAAGRAHDLSGSDYANGSNYYMALDSSFYTTKLRKTASNYYVVDTTCP